MTMPATAAPQRPDGPASSISLALAARIAGVGYVVIFFLAIFANFFVREGLVVSGDASATVANITASMGLFRLGLIAFLVVFAVDVVIAWALHVIFRTVNADMSLLMAWFRLVYAVFLGVALTFMFEAIQLLSAAEYIDALPSEQIAAQVMVAMGSFNYTWLIGLALFGVHLILVGVLIVWSDYVSKALGIALIVAGSAYAIDTLAHALLPNYEDFAGLFLIMVAVPSVIGEGWLGLWLLLTRRFRT